MTTNQLTKPQRKRRRWAGYRQEPPFPVPIATITQKTASCQRWYHYTAELKEGAVMVRCSGDMQYLFKMGFFGKGNLSRSRPEYCKFSVQKDDHFQEDGKQLRIISKRKYLRHRSWQMLADSNSGTLRMNDISKQEIFQEKFLHDNCQEQLIKSRDLKRRKLDSEGSDENKQKLSSPPDLQDSIVSRDNDETEDCSIESLKRIPRLKCEMNDPLDSVNDCDYDAWGGDGNSLDADPWGNDNEEEDPWQTENKETTEAFWGLEDSEPVQDNPSVNDERLDMGKLSDLDVTEHCNIVTENSTLHDKEINEGKTICILSDHSLNESKPTDLKTLSDEKMTECLSDECEENVMKVHPQDSSQQSEIFNEEISNTNQNERVSPPISDNVDRVKTFDPLCLSDEDEADLLVVNDTADEDDDYDDDIWTEPYGVTNNANRWRPVAKCDPFPLKEYLQLSLVEAFFLSYGLGCLVLLDKDKNPMSLKQIWQTFCKLEKNFIPNYAVYHNLRSKGWVPRSGLKYGSEFIIYKEGPPFYHSSYSVLVRMVRENDLKDDPKYQNRPLTWRSICGMNRVSEQVKKELMFCYVIKPSSLSDEDLNSPKCLKLFKIQEVVMKRWISSQERETKDPIEVP